MDSNIITIMKSISNMKRRYVQLRTIIRIVVVEVVKELLEKHQVVNPGQVEVDSLVMDFHQWVNSFYGLCPFQVCCFFFLIYLLFMFFFKSIFSHNQFLSTSAVFFLLASLAQRKKMSKTDTVLEEAAIKSAGVDKKYIPRIFVGVAIFIILLILFRRKILTWFFLTGVNVALLAYWIHLKNKADEKAAVNGFQLYGDGAPA
jgi:hypothetical protein